MMFKRKRSGFTHTKSVDFPGELQIVFYDDAAGVSRLAVTVDGGEVPAEIGATFTCRVVSIERTVVER